MRKKYRIKLRVWLWPGYAGWHFVTLDKKLSAKIREERGVGMISIKASVGQTSWQTSLLYHKLSQAYLIALKKDVRKKENIFVDDQITLQFSYA